MALLTTPAYNPSNPAPWVGDAIRLGLQIRQQREQDEMRQQQIQAQQMQQQAADQRRAFEFNRSEEFKRARTAADDARADRALNFQQQQAAAANAPFTLPSSLTPRSTGAPSYGIPALPSGGAASAVEAPVQAPDGAPEAASASPMDVEGYSDAPAATSADDPDDDAGLLKFVKGLEGFTPKAYGDFKQTSIGYGTRAKPGEKQISEEDATDRLRFELGQSMMRVSDARQKYGIPELTPQQMNALASFDYNTGSVEQLLKTRRTPEQIAAGMKLYTKAGGNELPGLVNRRNAEAQMFLSGAQAADPARETVTNYAATLADLGVPKKQALSSLTSVAQSVYSRKPAATEKSFEDVVGDAKYNPETKMYQREDGSEFFVDQTSKGYVQRAFKPSQSAARLRVGDDGQVYPFDSQGKPLKPLPEGVRFDKFNPKLVTKTVPGVGLVKVEPDGSTAVLIPQGVSVPASVSKSYLEASQELRNAQVELDAQTKLLAERPRGVTDWFGGSESSVKDAQKKFDEARAKVEGIRSDFPQLMPKGTATAPAQSAPAADPLAKARAAIAAGAPRDKVLARLQQAGIDTASL